MTRNEHLQLMAERKELLLMLSHLPNGAVLDRLGLDSRLKEIEALIGKEPKLGPEPARARVHLSGRARGDKPRDLRGVWRGGHGVVYRCGGGHGGVACVWTSQANGADTQAG